MNWKLWFLYWLLKPFKKLDYIRYLKVVKNSELLGVKKYDIIGSENCLITTKDIINYSEVRIIRYKKFKNYIIF